MTDRTVPVAHRLVGTGAEVYFVAEISANHGGDLRRALEIVRAAAEAGADAVKLQTYTPDTMTFPGDHEAFRIRGGTLWEGRRLYDLYQEASTPWEWHEPIREATLAAGLDFFSTAFDPTAIDFLDSLGVPLHKIASFELTDLDLIRRAAGTGKPLMLSTGMATVAEIDAAVGCAREHGCDGLILLRCNSAYPAHPSEMDLLTIPVMAETWGVPVGLSDHTVSPAAAIAAATLGACVIEKHLTLRRSDGGPDAAFSLEPDELRETIGLVREARAAVGTVRFGATNREKPSLGFRRSIFAVADIQMGDAFSAANIRVIRPAAGLAPRHLSMVLGRVASRDIPAGTPLSWDDVGQHAAPADPAVG